MSDAALLPHQRTDIYQACFELSARVRKAHIQHAELRDQSERASVSAFLAVSEGLPQASSRMRKQYFERARASVWECAGGIHLACELGAMTPDEWRACQSLIVRASAMLVALIRRSI
jgi:four helix bundle protein